MHSQTSVRWLNHGSQRIKKLHRRLAHNSTRVWTRTESGLHALSTALPFEPERLVELFKYIVRGVLFYHWNVQGPSRCPREPNMW